MHQHKEYCADTQTLTHRRAGKAKNSSRVYRVLLLIKLVLDIIPASNTIACTNQNMARHPRETDAPNPPGDMAGDQRACIRELVDCDSPIIMPYCKVNPDVVDCHRIGGAGGCVDTMQLFT